MPNEINATIQLDKLVMCCTSTIADNFNDAIKYYPEEAFKFFHSFGKTTLTQTIDNSLRFKYSYNVYYAGSLMGNISFCLFGQPHRDNQMWFSVNNKVFYNDTLQFLPTIFSNLNLRLNNITRLEVALDSYNFNFEQVLRRNIRNKENKVKLMGRNIDRKEYERRIDYRNSGSLDNPFHVRTVYIKNNRKTHYPKKTKSTKEENNPSDPKTTIELIAYNKLDEIKYSSPYKTYILDYHKAHNPKYKNIHRMEVRLESEELRRFVKKYKKPIELTDLLDKHFLYAVFTEYIDRIIVIRDNKKQKTELYPIPFLGTLEGKLPLPLPAMENVFQSPKNKEFSIIKNENHKENICNSNINNKDTYNKTFNIVYEKKNIIRRNQTENKQQPKRKQESQLREIIIT